MNSDILKNVKAEDYGFNIGDMAVAAMIKAYLQEMKVEEVPNTLGRIVSAKVLHLSGGTVKSRKLPREAWYTLDGAELATLIDCAKFAAQVDAGRWQAQKGERLLKKTVDYIRNDLFPGITGKRYVETMPAEMAEFITDCWLAAGGVEP